jgi:di/tricarboxylate transporter
MTLQQALSFAVLGGAIILFAWGRWRYDLIALGALLVGIVVGVVKPKAAFTGFTSDVVIIIACALVVSAAFARSGVAEMLIRPLIPRLKTARIQVPVFAAATSVLSMLTKNVGALAILMPVAIRVARRTRTSPSCLLMPMSFLALLGGLVTLVGTSTNIIASQVREETLGRPFEMFDFAPVGLGLTLVGLIFVSFGYRLLPSHRQAGAGLNEVIADAPFSVEARVPEGWPKSLAKVSDLRLAEDNVRVAAHIRGEGIRSLAFPDATLLPGDILVLEGDHDAIDRIYGRLPLVEAHRESRIRSVTPAEESRSVEAVIQPGSPLIGNSAQRVRLQQEYGVNLMAVGRSGERITERLRDVTLRAGDILVLQAGERALPSAMKALGILPLAERTVRLGVVRRRFLPVIILAAAIILVALKITPVAIGFFGAAMMIVLTGGLSIREAYGALEPEVLILIGALTPLSEAVRETGGTDLIAQGLALLLHDAPGLLALGAMMLAALLCSPFLHNAPTVLVMAPIGVALARALHLNPDTFLMAIATGAGCDFLTPIGHQCNTLVMRPGGYRFGDYPRLGAPLSVLVILIGTPLVAWVWPLAHAH